MFTVELSLGSRRGFPEQAPTSDRIRRPEREMEWLSRPENNMLKDVREHNTSASTWCGWNRGHTEGRGWGVLVRWRGEWAGLGWLLRDRLRSLDITVG